jgi:hypothetical protein
VNIREGPRIRRKPFSWVPCPQQTWGRAQPTFGFFTRWIGLFSIWDGRHRSHYGQQARLGKGLIWRCKVSRRHELSHPCSPSLLPVQPAIPKPRGSGPFWGRRSPVRLMAVRECSPRPAANLHTIAPSPPPPDK